MSASVAIIIPAYKPDFLRQTLDSISRQSSRDFHVYVADDCSPHDLKSIVSGFEGLIPLSYHRFEANMGGSDLVGHWHRSIALSHEEPYLWLFSDDDIMEPECVESFMKIPKDLRDNNIVHFDLAVLDSASGIISPRPAYPTRLSAEEYLKAKLEGRLVSYVVEFIMPRKLFNHTGGFENFDLAWGSDFMTWVKMASASPDGIVGINNPGSRVIWRQSGVNISPDSSYPVTLRKLNSLIRNAAFLQSFMHRHPDRFPLSQGDFRWLRFPLGEIFRKRAILSRRDVRDLCRTYSRTVGFRLRAHALSVLTLTAKFLSRK